MTDKLTFSFQGAVKVRIGGTEVDLEKAAHQFQYDGRNSSKTDELKGFEAGNGVFFRLKKHQDGKVDVIVYGPPDQLEKYQFKVKGGDLSRARFAQGEFRKPFVAREFSLAGRDLGPTDLNQSMNRLGLSAYARDASNLASATTENATTLLTESASPGVTAVRQSPANGLTRLDAGIRPDRDLASVLSRIVDTAGDRANPRLVDFAMRLRDELAGEELRRSEQPSESAKVTTSASGPVNDSPDLDGTATDRVQHVRRILIQRLNDDPELKLQVRLRLTDFEDDIGSDLLLDELLKQRSLESTSHRVDRIAQDVVRQQLGEQDAGSARADKAEALLMQAGLLKEKIPDDGHCMFAALAFALASSESDRARVRANPYQAAMSMREGLLQGSLTITDQQLNTALPGSNGNDRARSFYSETIRGIARGLEVKTVGQEAWGDPNTLKLAAMVLSRPVIAVDTDGTLTVFGAQGEYDATKLSLLNVRAALVSRGEAPLVIYKQSATHWNSAYEPYRG